MLKRGTPLRLNASRYTRLAALWARGIPVRDMTPSSAGWPYPYPLVELL